MSQAPRVCLASISSSVAMGQQAVVDGLLKGLTALGVPARSLVYSSWRGKEPGAIRVPLSVIESAPAAVGWGISRHQAGGALVHRLDLRAPAARGEILTVHDTAPLRFRDEGRFPRAARRQIRSASVIITGSEFIAEEIRTTYGVKDVTVIHHGIDDALFVEVAPSPTATPRHGLPADYVIHSGGSTTRKNLYALAAAWRAVAATRPDLTLVLCGPPDARRDAAFEAVQRVVRTGFVPRSVQIDLLRGARAAVVPSLYEGFGLPVLEAMACGTPVVVANCASLPEVSDGHALLVDPTAEGLASGILDAVGPAGQALVAGASAYARGFTWARSAQAHLDVYRQQA